MPEYMINDIPVNFPFEPYDVQKVFMEKLIESLKTSTNAILESPTGTGKTLSLLCSSLAWVLTKKAEQQAQMQAQKSQQQQVPKSNPSSGETMEDILAKIKGATTTSQKGGWGVPKIIYASRTHSQLTQAMHELKQTSYSFMRAVVLGSREQLCIHPEVMREQGNSNKVQMCKVRVQAKSCSFQLRVESKKDSPEFRMQPIMDVEDLVTIGQKLKMCPYYASKELVDDADITFMPYNYLLDPKARKANKVNLDNTIVILDEAHNVESLCEESASITIKSSDIALAIDDTTHIMKAMSEDLMGEVSDEPKDFTIDDLALLKEMLLSFEKAVDDIDVKNKGEGTTFPASYMFEVLEKGNITRSTANMVVSLLEKLLQFLAMASQNTIFRKGAGYEVLRDLITIVYFNKDECLDKIHKSFKVHVQLEEIKPQKQAGGKGDGWLTTKGPTVSKMAKVINYWCFNPGFGMEQLLNKNVRSIILTSGTLAPLKPLIAELSIPIAQSLENPHIVGKSQVCVKIVSYGPDKEQLISNYQNRDNPKYVNSLGRTILSFCPIIPDGLLVFFPSYPLMNKCIDSWQASGIWSQITRHKPIFVEPRNKDAFNQAMVEFYEKIRDPSTKGAIFMAVCRGKVSEGLDFADTNGRAVIITGLPFPPLKDPRVILKKRYLDENRTKENELLTGNSWYSLEATRAVNQAIGRVIRHRNDYGAILLCDARFNQVGQINQLSAWIREHLKGSKQHQNFGPVIGELSRFFRNAEKTLPKPSIRSVETLVSEIKDEPLLQPKQFADPALVLESKNKFKTAHFEALKIEKTNTITSWNSEDYSKAIGKPPSSTAPTAMDFISRLDSDISTIDFNACVTQSENTNLVTIHKRERTSPNHTPISGEAKKKRLKLVANNSSPVVLSQYSFNKPSISNVEAKSQELPTQHVDLLKLIKSSLSSDNYTKFVKALMAYKKDSSITDLLSVLTDVFGHPSMYYLLKGMRRFVKDQDKIKFDSTVQSIVG